MNKVVLITGASSGIGKSTAEYLSKKGFIIYGTSRNPSKYNYPNNYKLFQLDINDFNSINSLLNKILSKEKKIDILINNAGLGITGPAEETSITEMENNFKTNFFGPLNIIKKVLPIMRSKKSGLIINITSLAAYVGTPYRSVYSASKAALDLVSETLNMETKPFNIKVVTVAPGEFSTNIASRRYHASSEKSSPYYFNYSKALRLMNNHVDAGADPKLIGKLIFKIINSKNPKKKYIAGSFIEKIAPYLKTSNILIYQT